MKQVKFLATISVVTALLFLSSCNSGDDKKAEEPGTDTTTKKMEPPPPPVNPPGPTNVALIIHKVANYAKWKPLYDADDSARLANGLHDYVVARGTDDSNKVLVAFKIDDLEKAKAFSASKDLKAKMQKAGVTGAPTIDYLESVMNDTSAIQQTVRLMVRHKVKDWNTWKTAFDSHKQIRMDAGLTDRVISHTIGDDHSVTLVFAVADVDKAKAFMNSKDLKDKMKDAGVDGPPSFFFYKVVERH